MAAELQPIIVFHGRHFIRHLGICNPISVKLLHIISGIIPHNLRKKTTSLSQTVFLWSTNAAYTHKYIHRIYNEPQTHLFETIRTRQVLTVDVLYRLKHYNISLVTFNTKLLR